MNFPGFFIFQFIMFVIFHHFSVQISFVCHLSQGYQTKFVSLLYHMIVKSLETSLKTLYSYSIVVVWCI